MVAFHVCIITEYSYKQKSHLNLLLGIQSNCLHLPFDFAMVHTAAIKLKLIQQRGIVYVLMASAFFTINASVAKALKNIPPAEFSAIITYHPYFISLTMSFFSGYLPYSIRQKKNVFVYGSLRAAAYITKIFCIANMPLGDASALYFTSPIFAGIGARIFLGEEWGVFHLFSTVLGGYQYSQLVRCYILRHEFLYGTKI